MSPCSRLQGIVARPQTWDRQGIALQALSQLYSYPDRDPRFVGYAASRFEPTDKITKTDDKASSRGLGEPDNEAAMI
jgi:hypothetical protein